MPALPSRSRFTSPRNFMKNGVGGPLSWKGARSCSRDWSCLNGKTSASGSRKKSNGFNTDISATRSTSTSNSLVGSGRTTRARKLDCGSCCQLRKCFFRRNPERVAQDARAAMRRGPQAHDLRAKGHPPVIVVVGLVVESDVDGHGFGCYCAADWFVFLPGCGVLSRSAE